MSWLRGFDWVSPLIAIGKDVMNGPSRTFLIPVNCSYSGRDVIKLLRRNGIKSWGHMTINDTVTISVRKSQERMAEKLLNRHGIPY